MILSRAYGFIFSRVLVFFPFLWTPKIQGTTLITLARIWSLLEAGGGIHKNTSASLLRARVLVSKLFIPRLSLLVMAETGRNCAVSAFCFWVGVGIG